MTMGKSGNKRTAKQREADSIIITRYYLRGLTLRQVADKVNKINAERGLNYTISYVQVAYDLKKLLADWREERIENIESIMDKELKKLDMIEVEMWEQWEKSKRNKKTVKTSKRKDVEFVEETDAESTGDPRYMEVIIKCIEKRREMLGYTVGMPKPDTSGETGSTVPSLMTNEEMEKERNRIMQNMQIAYTANQTA